ncbi:hypothetical protein BpHYR1_000867 [Brachionus plicatilis]|uniref:Uncharacterized protein n=1 Tax=Brachionus plicatilis TaxID=10195 RepID=A0A3M7S321_BRAPC|nr:hypothetical protein BpHYR1_000867 [Brachionus plicatilis]
MVTHFRVPFCPHVFERSRTDNGKANEKNVGLRIRQRPQAVIVLLAGRVPQAQVHRLSVHHHIGRKIVEHRGYVFAWKGVCGVRYQQTCLSNGTVADHYAFDCLHCP